MSVLVPPTVFEKVQTVFHVPVMADTCQQRSGGDLLRIAAIGEIPRVVRDDRAVGGNQIAIDP
jgi:hypothetical protein